MITFESKLTVQMPANEITATGVAMIMKLLREENLPLPYPWLWVWIVERGEYSGTFPKRYGRWLHKTHQIKASVKVLEQLGNLARQHMAEAATHVIDFTYQIDWDAGDFGDGGSCYWGGREGAREMIYQNNGFAIRFYGDRYGKGRAWVAEIAADVYVVWNGYGLGGNSTLTAAMVLAYHLQVQYTQITLTNNGTSYDVLYINGGIGYAVGRWADIQDIDSHDLQWDVIHTYHCAECGEPLDEDDVYYGDDDQPYCSWCHSRLFDK